MNRNRLQIIVIVLLLVILGLFLGSNFIDLNPEKVVFFESNREDPQGTPSRFVPAAYVADEELPSLQQLNETFVRIADRVNPSVVTIITTKVIKLRGTPLFPGFDDEFFNRFFGIPPDAEREGTALGSGVIVNSKGYILTNNHVVERGKEILVKLMDNREFQAEIVGTDPRTDLAVIKIDTDDLTPATLGDSDDLRVGEWVLAIGSPFSDNLDHTVTAGIVSAKGRSNIINPQNYENFIQTDAAINPGNSGGALVNIRGELVGINTAIATEGGRAGNLGIGFAIPINLAKKVMTDLIEKGRVIRAWLGVLIQDVDDRTAKAMKLDTRNGALVGEVVADSPAEEAGVKVGDVIIEFDGIEIRNMSHLRNLVSNSEVGKEKQLVVLRGKRRKELGVVLAELPESVSERGSVAPGSTERLGIRAEELTPYLARQYNIDPDEDGVLVTEVERGSEAAQILRPGDLIQRIGEHEIKDMEDYERALEEASGDYILVLIKRRDNTFFVTLKLPE